MNKTRLPYERALYFIGLLNPSIIALAIMFSFNLAFPKTYTHAFFFSFLSLVPMLTVKVVSEMTDNRLIRCGSALLLILLSLFVPGEVMRPSWIIMLSVFSFVFVFCPHIEGRTMMTKAHIWDIIPLLAAYILSQILADTVMISAVTLLILTFILEYMLEKNMEGVKKEVMSRECLVNRDGIIKANRRVIILFVAVYLLLCLLIPMTVKLLSKEREETSAEYTFGEETERGTEEEKTPVERKEIRISKRAGTIDFSPLGTLLLYLFLAVVGAGIILSVVALFYRLFSVINSGRRRRSRLSPDETITESDITDVRKEKERDTSPGYFTPEGRIRRLYKGLVLSRGGGLSELRTMTTGEIEKNRDISRGVTELYERTRYRAAGADRESVKRMQSLVRENKKSSK